MQKFNPNMMAMAPQPIIPKTPQSIAFASIPKPGQSLGGKGRGQSLSGKGPMPKTGNQLTEIKKLRVPKNLVKRYNVMRIKAPRPIKFAEIKEANMVRKSKKQVFADEVQTRCIGKDTAE